MSGAAAITPAMVGPRARVAGVARPERLVWAATLFNFALCFAKTMGLPIGLPAVAAVQVLILALAGFAARAPLLCLVRPAVLLAGWLCVLALVNPGLELKIGVDLAVPAAFYWLGCRQGSARAADRLVLWLSFAVLAVGLYEMFALDSFEHYFNIFAYFLDKGALAASQAGDTGTSLAENGMRAAGDGRQLFPALGLHRVGSVFLEPISAGNFAVIAVAWWMATRGRGGSPARLLVPLFAAMIGVLADARFSVFTSAAVVVALLTPLWRSRLAVAVLPFGFIAVLLGFATYGGISHVDNSVAGRLYSSGALLAGWDWRNWLGLIPAGQGTFDAGYAYLISNLGLPALGLVWLAFAARPAANAPAARFRLALTIYMSLSLCISGSSLSIKTAALLWFLLGCLDRGTPSRPQAGLGAGRQGATLA